MATIAELVIRASVDPTGVRAGLDQSLGYLKSYATSATNAMKAAQADSIRNETESVAAYITSLKNRLSASQSAIREALFSGDLSPVAYEREAALNAQAYNAAITAGLKKFRSDGLSDAALEPLVASYSDAGRRAGLAFEREALTQMRRAQAEMDMIASQRRGDAGASFAQNLRNAGMIADTTGASFSRLGERGARMGIAVAFGMEQLANGSESGMRRALRAVASFGLAFGPEGLIVSALATGVLALMDYFHRAEKEAEESAKRIRDHIASAANAGKADDIFAQARTALYGQPYEQRGDKQVLMAPSDLVKGAFSGSLADLDAQKRILQQHLDDAQDMLQKTRIAQQMVKLEAMRAPKQAVFDAIQAAALNVAAQPADNAGKLAGVTTEARSPDAKDRDTGWKEEIARIKASVDAYKLLEQEHIQNAAAGSNLLSTYEKVSAAIEGMSDLTTKHARDLLTLRKEMQSTLLLQALAGPLPGVRVTPDTAHALAGKPSDAVKTAQDLLERQRLLAEAGSDGTQAYTDTIAALRIVDKYLADANDREGITNDRLREQLALRRALMDEQQRVAPLAQHKLDDVVPSLTGQVQRAQSSQRLAQAARETHADNAADLEAAANTERDKALAKIRAIIEASSTWTADTQAERDALASLVDLMALLGVKTDDTGASLTGIMQGLHGILDAASGLGKIPAWLNQGVNSAEHMLGALKEVQKAQKAADKTGGMFGSTENLVSVLGPMLSAVGSAVGIAGAIGSMFSQHDAALDRNTARLEELRNALTAQKGIAGDQSMETIVANIIANARTTGVQGLNGSVIDPRKLDALLKESGLSLEQMLASMKAAGIEFTGTLTSLKQFDEALRLSIQAAGQFSKNLDDQTALAKLHDKVYGLTSPTQQLQSELALLAQFAPKLRDQLGQIDVSTSDGRAALRLALQHLVDEIEAGTLTPEELGQLKGVKDLAGIIDTLSSGLDTLAGAAGAAASAINGVSWYKVNQAIYDIAPSRPATSPMKPSGPTDQTPWSPASSGANASASMVVYGDVIVQTTDSDPEVIRKKFLSKMQSRSQTLFATTKRWSEVQD